MRLAFVRPLLILIAVALVAVPATAEKAGFEEVTSVEGITEYRLPNGMQVLLFPDPSKPTVTVNITYLVGSRHEGRGEAGMAHLLEHMVFKGTPTYSSIWGSLEDHGARFNGTTWTDRTNYYETLPASDENLKFALHMEADRMVNSTIKAEDLAKEFSVVRNEFEMGENNPIGVLWDRMMSAAYLWHNYGKSTIGNRSDIERVPVPNLRAFYENYYQPDNAMLVVAGKFDEEMALALIGEYFGSIPRPERTLAETYTVEPPQDGARLVTLERVGDVAAAGLAYHVTSGSHADFAAISVLEDVLTSEPAGRLYKALVESGKASSVSGFAFPWKEPGVVLMLSEVRLDGDSKAVLHEMIDIVEEIGASEISDEEVERIKTRKLKNIKLAMADSGRIGIQLSEWAALGDWRMYFVNRDRMKAVTTADVKRVASTYFIASNRTAGLFTPTDEADRVTIPAPPNVAELVDGYEGTEQIAEGEVFEATFANIEKRTRRFELRPGLQVALLHKETRGDAVRATFRFRFGIETEMLGKREALELLPRILMRGTDARTFEELRDTIDQLQSRINVTGGVGSFGASIESDNANLVAAIELLGEILTSPRFDADEFSIVRKEAITQLEEGLSDPQTRGFNWLRRAASPWPSSSIHYVPTLEEQLEEVKTVEVAQLKKLHQHFYGANQGEIAIVGDFDPKAVEAALKAQFGAWKAPATYARLVKPHMAVQAKNETILTPDKKMAVVGAATTFPMRDDSPDYPALRFASYVLGSSAKSRLLERLRQQEGLSYGAGGQLQVDSQDERAAVFGFAICAPQNAAKAQDVMREELEKWVSGGVTEQELTEGKVSYKLKVDNSLANDAQVAGMLAESLELERTMEYDQKVMDQIQKLTTDSIKKVLEKHVGDQPWVEMKAGDVEEEEKPTKAAQK